MYVGMYELYENMYICMYSIIAHLIEWIYH